MLICFESLNSAGRIQGFAELPGHSTLYSIADVLLILALCAKQSIVLRESHNREQLVDSEHTHLNVGDAILRAELLHSLHRFRVTLGDFKIGRSILGEHGIHRSLVLSGNDCRTRTVSFVHRPSILRVHQICADEILFRIGRNRTAGLLNGCRSTLAILLVDEVRDVHQAQTVLCGYGRCWLVDADIIPLAVIDRHKAVVVLAGNRPRRLLDGYALGLVIAGKFFIRNLAFTTPSLDCVHTVGHGSSMLGGMYLPR